MAQIQSVPYITVLSTVPSVAGCIWDKAAMLVAEMKEIPCTFQPFSNCYYKHMFEGY
jgi:hypothetical protein